MKNDYVIDKVPYDKLVGEEKEHYGRVYYCHMRGFPDIPVFGSFGIKQYAQEICDSYNRKLKE